MSFAPQPPADWPLVRLVRNKAAGTTAAAGWDLIVIITQSNKSMGKWVQAKMRNSLDASAVIAGNGCEKLGAVGRPKIHVL
jgi:hypothetical protein